jgi:hypothetical protein
MLRVLLEYVSVVAYGLRLLKALNNSFGNSRFFGDRECLANLFLKFVVVFDHFGQCYVFDVVVEVSLELWGNLLESFVPYVGSDHSNLILFFNFYFYIEVDIKLEKLELKFSSFSIEEIRCSYLNLNSLGLLSRA